MGNRSAKCNGFTLMEVLVTVVIIGILAAIAYPSYTQYLVKTRRLDAINTLLKVQSDQERFRAKNITYALDFGPDGLGWESADVILTSSFDGYYNIQVVGTPTATAFKIKAYPKSSLGQAADTDCAAFVITQDGPDLEETKNSAGESNPACWRR